MTEGRVARGGDGSGRDAGPDELVLPMIFVPKGDAPPSDWIAAHPDYARLPATRVPRGEGRPPRGGAMWRIRHPGNPPAHPGGFGAEDGRLPALEDAVADWRATESLFAHPAEAAGLQLVSNETVVEPAGWTEPRAWQKEATPPSEAEKKRRAEMTGQIDAYIDRYLAKTDPNSPLRGKGWAFVAYGARFGVDPRFLLGLAIAETGLGKNVTSGKNNLFNNGHNNFDSVESSIYSTANSIGKSNGYYSKLQLFSLESLHHHYCDYKKDHKNCTDGFWTIKNTLNSLGGDSNDLRYYALPTEK
ncbi:MAG: glucosaminidase domain-containing protein [Bryobacteraceae bacterium]|nr:glucosaminidase domain-containing protein [Bryobacteraceae bacterium]